MLYIQHFPSSISNIAHVLYPTLLMSNAVCKQAPIDLGIVLDSSSSIYILDFKKAIKFLQDFLDRFDVGSGAEGVRVSIITYGKGIYPQVSGTTSSTSLFRCSFGVSESRPS
ncbi:hypothetical protein BsWGS_22123 [Bradybaena similaris]